MIRAYVLINVKPGKEREVIEILKNSKNIEDVSVVYGEYDVIAKVKAETLEELRKFVVEVIRTKDYVERTVTLIQAP